MTQQGRAMRGIFINEKDGIKAPSFDGTQPCAQTDPELFFPDTAGESVKGKQNAAPSSLHVFVGHDVLIPVAQYEPAGHNILIPSLI